MLKQLIKRTPVLRHVALWAMRQTVDHRRRNFASAAYWDERYRKGGNSGPGSYSRLALFKAEYLNSFVQENGIQTVLELGCGDGAQLELASYPNYVGVDVSTTVVAMANDRFSSSNRTFVTLEDYKERNVDLAISLDVIYHLVEDEVFDAHMKQLFAAGRYVIIYSSNEEVASDSPHVRHRRFTDWITANTNAILIDQTANPYPYDEANMDETSFADFYAYKCN